MREGTAPNELVALLGEGAEFDGKLIFEGRVRIDGKFRGEILSQGTLVVGDRAEVEASIDVGMLVVLGGLVRGEVHAQQSVELHTPARVFGNITTPQLMIDRGVVFEGQSRVPSAEAAPAVAAAGDATAEQAGQHLDPSTGSADE